ncbi:MAG: hypothetical protein R3B54_00335 [Bdellovibrionota bacterium]
MSASSNAHRSSPPRLQTTAKWVLFFQEVHQALRGVCLPNPPQVMIFMDGVCDVLAGLANFVNGVSDPAGKPEYDKYHYLFQMGKTGEVSWSDVAKKSDGSSSDP